MTSTRSNLRIIELAPARSSASSDVIECLRAAPSLPANGHILAQVAGSTLIDLSLASLLASVPAREGTDYLWERTVLLTSHGCFVVPFRFHYRVLLYLSVPPLNLFHDDLEKLSHPAKKTKIGMCHNRSWESRAYTYRVNTREREMRWEETQDKCASDNPRDKRRGRGGVCRNHANRHIHNEICRRE